MITLDTAGIIAALNRRDANHYAARQALLSERGPFLVPTGILSEAAYMIERYANLPLGLADAMVIACAERNGGRVLTFDARHFGVVARERTITVLPQL